MLSGNLTGLPKDSSERVSRNNVLRLQGINKQKLRALVLVLGNNYIS